MIQKVQPRWVSFGIYRLSLDGCLERLREPDSTDAEAKEFYDRGGAVDMNARSIKENRAFDRYLKAGGTSD